MSTKEMLLSQWILKVVSNYFKKQQQDNTPKIFIKISGLVDEELKNLLTIFKQNESRISVYYKPVIRLIKPINEYNEFNLKEHETSIWLRNNTKMNEALVLLINDLAPEAQSLENLFSIDEAFLLSEDGILELYEVLSNNYQLALEEIDDIKEFIKMYSQFSEPQLRNLLEFIAFIVSGNEISTVKSIQKGLPKMSLFVDEHLTLNKASFKRLQRNYNLANIGTKSENTEKLKEKMNAFMDAEEENNYPHEIWKSVTPDEFRELSLKFINNENKKILEYNFELIEEIFSFKEKSNIKDRIKTVLDYDKRSNEEKKDIDIGIESIEENKNPDEIQEFYEGFEEDLENDKNLRKTIIRRIEKLRNPSEYDDLSKALIYECFGILADHQEENLINHVHFELSVNESQLSDVEKQYIDLYVQNIEQIVPLIKFNKTDVEDDSSRKLKELRLLLSLFNNEQKIGEKSFKITNLSELSIDSYIEMINEDKLPKIIQYKDGSVKFEDIAHKVKKNIDHYIAQRNAEMSEEVELFNSFSSWYKALLKNVCSDGIFSVDPSQSEQKIEEYLSGVGKAVYITQQVYHPVMEIGTYDLCDHNPGNTGLVLERTLSIFNPIRLISYLKRYHEIQHILESWIRRCIESSLLVEQENEYLTHVTNQISQLSPRYYALDHEAKFLIEISETFGQGKFVLNNDLMSSTDYISSEISEELVKASKNYLDVYPYAKDSLDILFLFCQSSESVIKSIDVLFKKIKGLNKLRLGVHSLDAGRIHKEINEWISRKEEYSKAGIDRKFPCVEVKIFHGKDTEEIFDQVDADMIDTDIVVLSDYFGQSDQVQFVLERIRPHTSTKWFEKIELDPLRENESVKRIPYLSEKMPKALQYFYKMQQMFQKHSLPETDDLLVLKNTITVNSISSHLIDVIHEKFNWIMIMDRFLDKSLLQKTSSKAQIIQYRSKAGKNKNYKLIISSSKYIKNLNKSVQDYSYHDRLLRKVKEIMRNEDINQEAILDAVRDVKDISGALVLKAVGPGKYLHEMMATYLTIKEHKNNTADSLEVWSLCDELPWFNSRTRRPDLVITKIKESNDNMIDIEFFIKELKFVNHRIFEQERIDAIKQIKPAETLYNNIFSFQEDKLDANYWKDEMLHYLLERDAYSMYEADILKKLQEKNLNEINVSIDKSIDVFCYTSNLNDYEFAQNGKNIFRDWIHNKYLNNIYPRKYILKSLGASSEDEPNYPELEKDFLVEEKEAFKHSAGLSDEKKDKAMSDEEKKKYVDRNETNVDERNTKSLYFERDKSIEQKENEHSEVFPELAAFQDMKTEDDTQEVNDYAEMKKSYANTLIRNFSRNNTEIDVEDVIIGPGVIRIVVKIPSTVSQGRITSKRKDIQLWLEASQEPTIRIDKGKINIDVVRDEPDTIYFEKFMKRIREQIGDRISDKNLIAPLGLDPLNNVIFIDLSDATTPHLLVGGTTGSGKSVSLNSIILSTMCLYPIEHVKFVFIDPKQVEFSHYKNMKHTQKVIVDIETAVDVLDEMVSEMENRYKQFAEEYASNIDEYVEFTGKKLPHIVTIFDEFADFMSQEKELAKRVENSILRLGQKARAAGIHLIICTQHPKADIINTNIRNNLGARLALRTADSIASNVILDQDGAERLAGKGDFLAKTSYGNVERGKSPFLTPVAKRALFKYFEKFK